MADVGSQTSLFPGAIPAFPVQFEGADAPIEDATLAEGKDANLWSAESQAIAEVLGIGARGQSLLDFGTPAIAIGDLRVQVAGTLVTLPATPVLVLTGAVANFIYADLDAGIYVASTVGFPTDGTRFIPIATWDGLAPAVVDARPVNVGWGAPNWTKDGGGMALESASGNGQKTGVQIAEGFFTPLVGATHTFVGLIPAGSMVIGVTSRVTALITGATDFDLGDGTTVDKFGAALPVAATSTSDLTDSTVTAPTIYTVATDVVLTANGGAFTAGDIRVAVHYLILTAPTS